MIARGLTQETKATLTGLEPATSAVTGRRANQLRYRALLFMFLPETRVTSYQSFRTGLCTSCVPPTGFEPVPPP
jgi:hypothetical protein